MKRMRCLFAITLLSPLLAQAQHASVPGMVAPILQPGEGLAWASSDGTSKVFGEAALEASTGSLANLLWLRLDGEEWAARMVSFKCKGVLNGVRCWNPKGHGKVDLGKATLDSCNLAFFSWSMESAARWKQDYGDGAARYRLEQVFNTFLGPRLKAGDTLPVLGPEWIGDGELLQTTPLAMAKWLAHPDQEPLLTLCRRLMGGVFDGWITKGAEWWFITGTSPMTSLALVSTDPSKPFTWVVGSNGERAVVLHLSKGHGKGEALARMKEILLLPKR